MSKNIFTDVRTTLLSAAKILRDRGHCKGKLQDDDGHVCAIGAINVAVGGDAFFNANDGTEELIEIRDRTISAVGSNLPIQDGEFDLRSRVALWNNDCSRTAEQVIHAIEHSAGIV